MEKWLKDLKEKLKAEYGNLPDDEDNDMLDEEGAGADTLLTGIPQEEESEDGEYENCDGGDSQPPAKRPSITFSITVITVISCIISWF